MEATKEGAGLLDKILPPRLEDAGLEDCALPPDSIQEAFHKAAIAVRSTAAALFDASFDEAEEGGCVTEPWPTTKEKETDILVGVEPPSPGASDSVVVGGALTGKGPCLAGKGGPEVAEEEEGRDAVAIAGEEEKEGLKECGGDGSGVKGLGIEGRKKNRDEDEEEVEDRPILVEGVV